MSNKTVFLKSEGDNWFLRNINKFEQRTKMESSELLYSWLKPFSDSINTICEIGCGNGHNLSYLSEMLDASGYGIDPSKKANEYISKKFPKIKTMIGTGDDIQFEDDQFDHVHLGFFLYLVDRKHFLRCISEADRILKNGGFLSILDFDVPYRHTNEYSHHKDINVFKLDNSKIFQETGFYTLMSKFTFSHDKFYFEKNMNERISITLLHKDYKSH